MKNTDGQERFPAACETKLVFFEGQVCVSSPQKRSLTKLVLQRKHTAAADFAKTRSGRQFHGNITRCLPARAPAVRPSPSAGGHMADQLHEATVGCWRRRSVISHLHAAAVVCRSKHAIFGVFFALPFPCECEERSFARRLGTNTRPMELEATRRCSTGRIILLSATASPSHRVAAAHAPTRCTTPQTSARGTFPYTAPATWRCGSSAASAATPTAGCV